jgi:serine/threonine protein kinase/formylglycine-generating enzyme required for sulfatase activity
MTSPADNRKPRLPDAEDANATVPVKGWNDAATIPAARPAPGSAVNLDKTVIADFNRSQPEADTQPTRPAPQRSDPQADTVPTRVAPQLGNEVTLLADSSPGSAALSDPAVLVRTRPTGGATGSETPMGSTALSQSGALSRSFSRTGRTRVNMNLPAEAQQLDQKLQMSRTSVLSDMATARIGKGDLPPGIAKLIDQQGTEGRYAIDRPLAAGGMGAVLQINDHDFRRPAAMKVILSKYAASAEATERFLAEAQVTAQLEHPNIVPIHDLGVMDDGTLYFTMKLIEGMSLGRVVKLLQQQAGTLKDKDGTLVAPDAESAAAQKKWTVEEKLLTFLKVLDGVGFAHSRGVVHRDLKPDNVMLGSHGEVLVVDWGIAKVLGSADTQNELVRKVASLRDQQSVSATMDGSAMGTLYYMPPEQALGNVSEVDARSDVYALGATLYELLALRRCLDAGNMADMIARISGGAWNRLDAVAPHLDQDLVAIVHRAMGRDPKDRYQSCDDFAADIRRHLAGQAVHARRRNFIERIGLWYAAHRRQVQVGAAGVALVVGAVFGTLVVSGQTARAESRALLAQAKLDYDAGRVGADGAALNRAQTGLVKADALNPGNREITELTYLVGLAIETAKRDEQERIQREAASQRAQGLLVDARKQIGANNLEGAERTLDAALKLAPGDEAISNLLKEVVRVLGNKAEQKTREQAQDDRNSGDQALAQAEALDLADLQVDALLRRAEDFFAKSASTKISIAGTQTQVKKAALLRQSAEIARKTKQDLQKGEAAAAAARTALDAKQFPQAKDAAAQALGFIPNRADLVALRDRILIEENAALTAAQEAERQRKADALAATARTALAAGDLLAAREAAAQAWGLVPGHAQTEQLRQRIAESERQAVALARVSEIRSKATASLIAANEHRAKLQEANRTYATATAEVDSLTVRLADQPTSKKAVLWQAHRNAQTAVTTVSEEWSLTEAAAQSVLSFLAEDPGNPAIEQAKTILADLYKDRLTDARRRRDVANVAAFANLLTRYDDGRYAALLKDFGRLTITGPVGARIRINELEAGPDLRLVPVGKASEITLPAEPLALKGGRYQLQSGTVLISVVVDATAPVALTWPAALPTISGVPLRYVPPMEGRRAFLLGEREVTGREYERFLRDPAVWKRAVEGYKAFYLDGGDDVALLRLIPREPGRCVWQAEQAEGFVLTRLTMPSSAADLAVSGISRDDAAEYCAWLAKQSGVKVRLPTRAEWQSAAHGGDVRRPYPWGDVFDGSLTVGVWAPDGSKRDGPAAPGSVPADVGPFGHLDLAGNLSEWVSDAASAHGAELVGGSWAGYRPDNFRTTMYESAQPFFTNATIGFRILVEIP